MLVRCIYSVVALLPVYNAPSNDMIPVKLEASSHLSIESSLMELLVSDSEGTVYHNALSNSLPPLPVLLLRPDN